MNTNKTLIRVVIFSLLLVIAGSGAALAFAQAISVSASQADVSNTHAAAVVAASVANPLPAAVISAAPATSLDTIQNTFEQIYQKVNPSVVNIQVVEQASSNSGGFGFNNPQSQPAQQALGSGFVWDTSGHIVTNNHVVSGATSIMVTFWDGTEASAKLVGADPNSDLAVIQVNVPASKLTPVQLADSSKVVVGQLAVAIGNPFGLQNTMTQGVISGLSRSLPVGLDNQNSQQGTIYSIPDIIQTDASINPGNSGGVLVDDQGNLIGVTAAIESQSGSSAGIGFVIPSAIVAREVPTLIKTGTYNHASLGITSTNLTPEIIQAMGLDQNQQGALIVGVTPNGPADNAGLIGSNQRIRINGVRMLIGGDIITAIDGQPLKSSDELGSYLFDNSQVGQTLTLTVLRSGHSKQVKVTLGVLPAQ